MEVKLKGRKAAKGTKLRWTLTWGRGKGKREPTGIFTYTKPKTEIEKNHNIEAMNILKSKQSQMTLDAQSINTAYIPSHKVKINFLDYCDEYVKNNTGKSRNLKCSIAAFKTYIKPKFGAFISPVDVTKTLCEHYRKYLLDKYNGETPGGYFAKLKKILSAACDDKYYRVSPAHNVAAKKHESSRKDILEVNEYRLLFKTSCESPQVMNAAIFCMYTGLRWCDVKVLRWEHIKTETFLIRQVKTKNFVEVPLHPYAASVIGPKKEYGLVFTLPTLNGANKTLGKWVRRAHIKKHITWHSLRHSVSVLLQDEGVAPPTVAGMLGQKSAKFVFTTYQRYRLPAAKAAITHLPTYH